jgi:small nuclear ribonucleoprotein
MMSTPTKPFDVLVRSLNSVVLVGLKGGQIIRGKLAGFDPHVNLVLEDAEELKDGEVIRRYGRMVIRGDNVIFISPS